MLHTMIADYNRYSLFAWDKAHLDSVVGKINGDTITQRIDMNHEPISFIDIYNTPLKVNFSSPKGKKNRPIPDISMHYGRLFLTVRAYEALKPKIQNDGEFLPCEYEKGDAFIFNPLRVAERAGALNSNLSRKNEWGDVENLGFYEEKIKSWSVFRCEFNNFITLQCCQSVKSIIDEVGLTGLYITPELGCLFPRDESDTAKIN